MKAREKERTSEEVTVKHKGRSEKECWREIRTSDISNNTILLEKKKRKPHSNTSPLNTDSEENYKMKKKKKPCKNLFLERFKRRLLGTSYPTTVRSSRRP